MLALNSISKLDFSFLENNSIFKPLYKMIEIKIIIKAINNIKNSAKFIHWPLIIIFFIWNCLGFVFKSLNFFIIYSSSSIIMDLTSSAAS